MQAKDYYKILGVSENATEDELKKSFRKIAQASHPDRNPGDKAAEERFKEASEAYEILSNPEKRQKYDALRKYGFGEAFRPGGQGFPGGFPGGTRIHFDTGNLQDFDFADIFTEDSPFSSVFEQLFEQMGISPVGERGRRRGPRVRPARRPGRTHRAASRIDDDFFRQDGLDVHCTIWLKLEQLERGVRVKVRTPGGKKVLLTVPADTKIGTVLRIPGMGLATTGRRGDQYVHIEGVA